MSRRTTSLTPIVTDGTSQHSRATAALDPSYARIDERGSADLMAFVQSFVEQLRFFEASGDAVREAGSWLGFATHGALTAEDFAAYVANPALFSGEDARWLSRPHFALLLTFVELMRHVRDQQNELTRRHLDFYYTDILQMSPLPARADRVAVLFELGSQVPELLLPAGTALSAGPDAAGVERIYRTERDLLINRARVAELRSLYVDRRITEIPDARDDTSLTAAGAFDATLRIALGAPSPGDPVEPWRGSEVNTAFFAGLRPTLDFCRAALYLEHYELRSLMQIVRRRQSDAREWSEINRLLGVTDPRDPRDFDANLESVVGPLDFDADGLPQVDDIDDVYTHRTEPDVRAYIDTRLAAIGYDDFTALMPIKLRIDAEWAEINRTLERLGRRQRGDYTWTLAPADPMDFDANLTRALGSAWPPSWPMSSSIYEYDALLRELEAHLCTTVERAQVLTSFAESLGERPDADGFDWSEVDPILIDAHAELVYTGRRDLLMAVRGDDDSLLGFDRVVTHVLNHGKLDPLLAWESARPELAKLLDAGQLSVLDGFRDQITWDGASQVFGWSDVLRVLEFAQRYVESYPEPLARKVEWRNLYPYADATTCLDDATSSPRWNTFGAPPAADKNTAPAANLGFALRSPMLSLSQGTRTITLTFGFSADGFDLDALLASAGLDPATLTPEALVAALAQLFVIDVSTAKGPIELPISKAKLAAGTPGDDYWSILGQSRAEADDRPALQLELLANVTCAPLAPLPTESAPKLRMMLRPRWDEKAQQWITGLGSFELLRVAAVHLAVRVEGLRDLRLQQDDRKLDPRKPFEPFGSRPAVGSTLWLSHPELIRNRLELLCLDLSWMGLPASLADHYLNYPGITGGASFQVQLSLIDQNLGLNLTSLPLFDDDGAKMTASTRALQVDSVAGQIADSNATFTYIRRTDLSPGADLRADSRALRWTLTPTDFGHAAYPSLAATKAREQAVDLANGKITDTAAAAAYRVDAPYTPLLQGLSATYTAAEGLDPLQPNGIDELLHVHPFGETRINADHTTLLPRYESAGELYIGLSGLAPPQSLALLMQLAEGTSDPELEPGEVSWSALDGDGWRSLVVLSDSTRGLINSGIVGLELPAVAAGTQLPGGRYWLRVSIARNPSSVCDAVDIRPQAVFAQLEDRGNAPEHYAEPLPPNSVSRLVQPDARITTIAQPYTSFDGEPAEAAERLHVRVSERLRHKQRALSGRDYERLVLQQFGTIFKAKCLPAAAGGLVELIVIPDIRDALPADALAPKAPANQLADIAAYLSARAPASASVAVRNARYVPVRVRLGVRFLADEDEGFARKRLNEDLVRFLSPWAYDEGQELMIGGKIYAASVVDFVDRRPYVDYVAQITLFRGDGAGNFAPVPAMEDYHVSTAAPDEVLVSATQHDIDIIPEIGYEQSSFTGINYMKIELDFIVGA